MCAFRLVVSYTCTFYFFAIQVSPTLFFNGIKKYVTLLNNKNHFHHRDQIRTWTSLHNNSTTVKQPTKNNSRQHHFLRCLEETFNTMAHPDFISQTHSPESWPWPWPSRRQSSAASPAWCWPARGCRPAAGQSLMGSPRAVGRTAPPGSPAPEWCRHGWAWRRRRQCWSWRWRVCKDQRNEVTERMRWRERGRLDKWLFQQIPAGW